MIKVMESEYIEMIESLASERSPLSSFDDILGAVFFVLIFLASAEVTHIMAIAANIRTVNSLSPG